MTECLEIIKKVLSMQLEISQAIDKYNKKSFSTRSQISQNALIQSKNFKPAKNFIGETISDTDTELEQKGNVIQFS